MVDTNLFKLAVQLKEAEDGLKFHKLLDKLLKKHTTSDRVAVIEVLIDYAKQGKIPHCRAAVIPKISNLVNEKEENYADFFAWAITQTEFTYWATDGLLKTQAESAYPSLIELAKNENIETEIRAKAIKSMATASQQPFDHNLPKDPGYWKLADLRIEEIENWQQLGYPTGAGYNPPKTPPALKNPKTALENIVASLEKKLAVQRSMNQDAANPSNWLVIAEEATIAKITKKWALPETYLTFMKYFSPVKVYIDSELYFQGLDLYGAEDLISRQAGYAFDAVTNETLADWPANFLVIADAGADPYCIDLNNIKDQDAPIYTCIHGAGAWEFELYTDSFLSFMKEIAE